jgi:hypothetical protein
VGGDQADEARRAAVAGRDPAPHQHPRDTIRRALASSEPPSYGPRPPRASKLDPFVGTIEELLADEPTLSGVRIREELM